MFQKHIFKDRKLIFQRAGVLKEEKHVLEGINEEILKPRWQQNFEDLGRALERFKEALQIPLDEHRFNVDIAILRFEFTIELFWKNFKNFVEMEKIKVISPRDAVSKAYQMEWIDNEKLWISMLEDRNVLSHDYNEEKADNVYVRIITYYPEMQGVYERLGKMYVNDSPSLQAS